MFNIIMKILVLQVDLDVPCQPVDLKTKNDLGAPQITSNSKFAIVPSMNNNMH